MKNLSGPPSGHVADTSLKKNELKKQHHYILHGVFLHFFFACLFFSSVCYHISCGGGHDSLLPFFSFFCFLWFFFFDLSSWFFVCFVSLFHRMCMSCLSYLLVVLIDSCVRAGTRHTFPDRQKISNEVEATAH